MMAHYCHVSYVFCLGIPSYKVGLESPDPDSVTRDPEIKKT